MPQTEVKIVSPATGETVPVGVVGEVCARSICVMKGYFDDPKSTAEAWIQKVGCTPETLAAWMQTDIAASRVV